MNSDMKINMDYAMNKPIIVFGTGVDGFRCLNVLSRQYNVRPEYFVVNNCQQDKIKDFSVLECSRENIKGKFVIVATRETTYISIKEQFCKMGLMEFKDFIYYEWMFKKLVLLHGNCHLDVVESLLRSSSRFCNQYSIYPLFRICMIQEERIPLEVLHNVDLWIHEDIQENNSYSYFFSDKYLRDNMSDSIKEIIIPHLFGLGKLLFPYSEPNTRNPRLSNEQDRNGMFPHADLLIDRCVEKGLSIEKIVECCLDENALSAYEVMRNFENYMEKIRFREKNWDIKIADYISENYRKCKLFYDMGHPTNVLLKHITEKLLQKLDINEEIYTDLCLDYHEVPVYPTVRKHLKLDWEEKFIRQSDMAKRIESQMDMEEYVREYLFWCYQM